MAKRSFKKHGPGRYLTGITPTPVNGRRQAIREAFQSRTGHTLIKSPVER